MDKQFTAEELIAAAAKERCEVLARVMEPDPHQWSTRPCQTCQVVSELLGRPFGCVAKAQRATG
jgi:hypothetical protein